MLIDNINYLRKNYPDIRAKLKELEGNADRTFEVEATRKGTHTLSYIKEEKKQYFHSKYDPIKEAEIIAEPYKNLDGKAIVFYGTGLGYHIDLIVKANPDSSIYIFEPIPELLEVFLSEQNLSKPLYSNLRMINMGLENLEAEWSDVVRLHMGGVEIIELPSHKQYFAEVYKQFVNTLTSVTRNNRFIFGTGALFQKKWTQNTMRNMKEILASPNILNEKMGQFRGKPAILVAAGPSLNEEIENLRYIKENNLAYIFSVGSAINTLIHNGIYPHATTAYDQQDPTETGIDVLGVIKEDKITDIPLIFGTTIGFTAIADYPGPKYHFLITQDNVNNYYLFREDEPRLTVHGGPSIAFVTLNMLAMFGFEPIILVGQNFAYMGNKDYSEGIRYAEDLSEEKQENALVVEDVYGGKVKTRADFNVMREAMEGLIQQIEPYSIINTTKGGAKIKGTVFRELESVIQQDLKEKITEEDWLDCKEDHYDKETLKSNRTKMNQAAEELANILKNYNRTLDNMFRDLEAMNYNQLELSYDKLNKVITDLENNDFFMTFILNMNQLSYEFLLNAVKRYRLEKNIHKKHKDLLDEYKTFIANCGRDFDEIKGLYEEMNQDIQAYVEK